MPPTAWQPCDFRARRVYALAGLRGCVVPMNPFAKLVMWERGYAPLATCCGMLDRPSRVLKKRPRAERAGLLGAVGVFRGVFQGFGLPSPAPPGASQRAG